MNPRRTHESNAVLSLPGGTEDDDLWVKHDVTEDDVPIIISTWEPSDEERQAIAEGANIELSVLGVCPPVMVGITNIALGRRPTDE